jgi:hypothetical protein
MPNQEKPSTLVLRLNQEIHAPRLLVHGADRTWRHPTSRSSGHRVPNLLLIIPGPLHQVSYCYLYPHRCPLCHTCHLHIMRQANVIFHTNKDNSVEPQKCLRFEFKPRRVNDSSQSNQGTDHLISQLIMRGYPSGFGIKSGWSLRSKVMGTSNHFRYSGGEFLLPP